MEDIKKLLEAKIEYEKLLAAADAVDLPYDKIPNVLGIAFGLPCDNTPAAFQVVVEKELNIVRLTAVTPVLFPTVNFENGAAAVAHINYGLTDGHFDLDLKTGKLTFTICVYYGGVKTDEAIYSRMLSLAAKDIAKYGEPLGKLSVGILRLEDTIE